MTDEEALTKVRGAFEEIQLAHSDDINAIKEAMKTRRTEDPELFEALKRTGQMMQQAQHGH